MLAIRSCLRPCRPAAGPTAACRCCRQQPAKQLSILPLPSWVYVAAPGYLNTVLCVAVTSQHGRSQGPALQQVRRPPSPLASCDRTHSPRVGRAAAGGCTITGIVGDNVGAAAAVGLSTSMPAVLPQATRSPHLCARRRPLPFHVLPVGQCPGVWLGQRPLQELHNRLPCGTAGGRIAPQQCSSCELNDAVADAACGTTSTELGLSPQAAGAVHACRAHLSVK